MYNYTGKQMSDLIEASIGLSRIVRNGPVDRKTIEEVFEPKKYMEMAKPFICIPEIKEMYDKVEKILYKK